MQDQFVEIKKVIDCFFESIAKGEQPKEDILYSNAPGIYVKSGKIRRFPVCELRKETGFRAGEDENENYRLLYMDITEDAMACAGFQYSDQRGSRKGILVLAMDAGKWKVIHLLLGHSGNYFDNWFDNLESQSQAHRQIEETVARYVEGVYRLDSVYALQEFQEETRMMNTDAEGNLADVAIQILKERWKGEESAESLKIPKLSHFESIIGIGENTALVKVFDTKRWNAYFDYLSLAKEDDVWKIVNKVTILPRLIEET